MQPGPPQRGRPAGPGRRGLPSLWVPALVLAFVQVAGSSVAGRHQTARVDLDWLGYLLLLAGPALLLLRRRKPVEVAAGTAVVTLLYTILGYPYGPVFASLVVAVRQGRRIYDNITKATRFVVAVHIPVVALALVPSLLHWPILLMPVQIVLLELLIDPACSIVFESAKASPAIMRRPPRPIGESPFRGVNLGYGIAQGMGLAAVLLLGYAFALGRGIGIEQVQLHLRECLRAVSDLKEEVGHG